MSIIICVRMNALHERLKQERHRLEYNQEVMAQKGGVKRRAQINYESGVRCPDGHYLSAIAAAGADVQYILTGERSIKIDTLAHLEKAADSNDKKLNLSYLDKTVKNDNSESLFAGSNHHQLADKDGADYSSQNNLTPREKALLDNYRNIPDKEDQGGIEKMALIAVKASREADQTTGTETKRLAGKP